MLLPLLGLWGRGIAGILLGVTATTSPAAWPDPSGGPPGPEFAALTTRAGVEHFGIIIAETTETLTLRHLGDLKEVTLQRTEILTLARSLDENEAFAREELGAAVAWKLSTLSTRGTTSPGRLAVIPLATEPDVSREGLAAFEAAILTSLARHQVQVIDPGQVEKALTEATLRDPLSPPALPLGKALNADWVLTGKAVADGPTRKLHYRLLDVASGRTIVAGMKLIPPPLVPAPTTAPSPAPPSPATGAKTLPPPPAESGDLSGPWVVYRRNSKVRVQLIRLANDRFTLKSGLSFAGEYELRGNKLVMVTSSHTPPPKEMLIWLRQGDGSFSLITGSMSGYRLARDNQSSVSPNRP